jgi:hypothetical protein
MLKQFLRNNRFASAIFVVLLLARIGFELWAQGISAPPLDAPIALSSAGGADRRIDQRIRIRVPDSYSLELSLRADARGMDHLRGLLGDGGHDSQGKPIPSGVRIPLRWSLSQADSGAIVAQGDTETFGSSSWSSDEIGREVDRIAVPPGQYRLQAQITRDVPEFAGIQARLGMRLNSKAAGSWQTSRVWDGRLLSLFLIDPGLVLLALFLLWRAFALGRSRWRTRAQAQA